ncbi:hypothetical protein E2P81_ATG08918 [Venturia nashicola]|nr:hypothetical protein E2P81_ATG08918 [Venturia nashicola]
MSTLLTGPDNRGAIVGLPSAPQEEQDSLQLSSHNNMATVSVEPPFTDAQGHQQYDGIMPLSSHSLQPSYSSDRGGDSMMQMENYQLFQPSTSYMNPHALDYTHYNHHLFTPSQYAPNIDSTIPRSIITSCVSAHDGPYSSFTSTVAPHQVYPNLAPTSYADPSYHEDEYEQHQQQDNDLITIQDHELVPHSIYHRQHDEIASHTATGYGDDGMSIDVDNDGDKAEPYAKSLFRCLRNAPAHTMVLREIYDWFKANTDKARASSSLRDHLIANNPQAFEKVEAPGEDSNKKGGYQWRLSEQALRDGRVQSTTRYRNKDPKKRGNRNHHPAPHRQASGARGGIMSRRSHQLRQSERLRKLRRESEDHSIRLRAQGIIAPHNGGTPRSTGYDSHSTSAAPSGPSSPYFFPPEPLYALPSAAYDSQSLNYAQYSALQDDSTSATPEPQDVPDLHFAPLRNSLFYDRESASIESGSEPQTPSNFDYDQNFDIIW